MTDQEKARLEELKGKADLSPEEQAELTALEEKAAQAAGAAANTDKGKGKGKGKGKVPGEEQPAADTEVTATFDTEGAQHVVTIRNGKAVKVWFKDGKEIGVEDVG